MPYSYNCREYLGMEECPGSFVAASKEGVLKHVELHAREDHGEAPARSGLKKRRRGSRTSFGPPLNSPVRVPFGRGSSVESSGPPSFALIHQRPRR
jgi:uncharacterized protein DUF1059